MWVACGKDEYGIRRVAVFDEVRKLLRLMGIRYARRPAFPAGSIDYVEHEYVLKIIVEEESESQI